MYCEPILRRPFEAIVNMLCVKQNVSSNLRQVSSTRGKMARRRFGRRQAPAMAWQRPRERRNPVVGRTTWLSVTELPAFNRLFGRTRAFCIANSLIVCSVALCRVPPAAVSCCMPGNRRTSTSPMQIAPVQRISCRKVSCPTGLLLTNVRLDSRVGDLCAT